MDDAAVGVPRDGAIQPRRIKSRLAPLAALISQALLSLIVSRGRGAVRSTEVESFRGAEKTRHGLLRAGEVGLALGRKRGGFPTPIAAGRHGYGCGAGMQSAASPRGTSRRAVRGSTPTLVRTTIRGSAPMAGPDSASSPEDEARAVGAVRR